MSDIIKFPDKGLPGRDNVITTKPMRLRWGEWRSNKILQVHVGAAAIYEDFRQECIEQGHDPASQVPPAHELSGGIRETALALLRFRNNEQQQRRAYYLAALLEALITAPCAILRTDLIRRVYREVETLSDELGLRWSSHSGRLMLLLEQDAKDPDMMNKRLENIDNLSRFFDEIRDISGSRYQALATNYILYYPRFVGIN